MLVGFTFSKFLWNRFYILKGRNCGPAFIISWCVNLSRGNTFFSSSWKWSTLFYLRSAGTAFPDFVVAFGISEFESLGQVYILFIFPLKKDLLLLAFHSLLAFQSFLINRLIVIYNTKIKMFSHGYKIFNQQTFWAVIQNICIEINRHYCHITCV